MCPQDCFNGAATYRSRKLVVPAVDVGATPQLQWGRDLTVAEIQGGGFFDGLLTLLQWGRDLTVAEMSRAPRGRCSRRSGFNGAAT